jgi:uncharacterized protein YbbK (DUF523 family)
MRIGISSCLLGDAVRFDGGHKRAVSLIAAFDPDVEWVRVCPEVELGMGVPREPVHLVGTAEGTRMIAVHTRIDFTAAMRDYAARRVRQLAAANLSGYVLKAKSPSCGPHDVSVHDDQGRVTATAAGLFAEALRAALPQLPVEDELRLEDPGARAAFLSRVRAYAAQRVRSGHHV